MCRYDVGCELRSWLNGIQEQAIDPDSDADPETEAATNRDRDRKDRKKRHAKKQGPIFRR